jgi:hypothetical protein
MKPSILQFLHNGSFELLPKATKQSFLNTLQTKRLYPFALRAMQELVGVERCYHNYHLEVISHWLELCAAGEKKRLIVNMPPRHLKTTLCNVIFPAWLMGRDPSQKIISASYSQEIANDPSRKFRELVQTEYFRNLFPEFIIAKKKTENHVGTTQDGFRYAVGMRGTITGKGANYIIIDDPHKPEEVLSPMIRNADNEWVENTLLSRLDNQNDGRIIVVMQRLHISDLAGYLIEKGGWEVLSIPAISTQKKYFDIKVVDDSYSRIERSAMSRSYHKLLI